MVRRRDGLPLIGGGLVLAAVGVTCLSVFNFGGVTLRMFYTPLAVGTLLTLWGVGIVLGIVKKTP